MSIQSDKAVVVIPVYKPELNEYEQISFKRCVEVLHKHPIVLIAPEDLDLSLYKKIFPNFSVVRFPSHYFKDIASYNKLLLSSMFYKRFLNYQYILIYQLDVFVFYDGLLDWCSKGYDFVGAPWIDREWILKLKKKTKLPVDKIINRVGNGGFSLRKVKTFYWGAIYLRWVTLFWNYRYHEDFFWSTIAYRLIPSFKIPKWKEALHFAFEDNPAKAFEVTQGELPFGCHAWHKYNMDFWRAQFKKYGYDI